MRSECLQLPGPSGKTSVVLGLPKREWWGPFCVFGKWMEATPANVVCIASKVQGGPFLSCHGFMIQQVICSEFWLLGKKKVHQIDR